MDKLYIHLLLTGDIMNADEIINCYSLNKKTWTHKGFHGILHFFFAVGEQALNPMKKYYGNSHTITVFYFSNNLGDWYWCNEDMVRLRKWFIKRAYENPAMLTKLKKDWHISLKRLNEIIKTIDTTDLSALDNNELLGIYNKWYYAYLEEYGIAIGIQDSFSMHAQDFLLPHFSKIIAGKGYAQYCDEYYLALISSVNESFITQEYRDRLHLLSVMKNKKLQLKDMQKYLEKHAKKYHWIHNNYAKDICLDAAYFASQLKEIESFNPDKELQKLDEELKEIKKKKAALIKKLSLNAESIILLKIVELFAYMQDERKKYVLLASHYQRIFMDECGKRLKLDRRAMEYTYIHELKDILSGKIKKDVFEERRSGVLVIHTLNKYEVISGNLAKEIHKKIFEKEQEDVTEIKGMIACQGKVSGLVKIVRTIHDVINVSQGDVLVASMTRPEMVLAMRKAVAIVTDEGGITSHAAIVSRELGIPCIIGTKIATKVLRDGDMVEVDADKGIVRKLK